MRFHGTATATDKGGNSPVTEADHAANAVLVAALREAFPEDGFLSEESRDSRERLEMSRVWIVDPLDGTKEFLKGIPEFAVMVGLAARGRAVLGAVYVPPTDTLYLGAEGEGAWVERNGERTPLVAPPAADAERLRLVGSRSHPDPLLVRIQEALGITDVRPSGSVGVKCALIAEGERDLYLHPVPYLKEWDTCAPEAVLRAAGGTVTDCRGGPLRYNKPDPVMPDGILAAAPGVADGVVSRVVPLYAGARAAA
jgi:3'(2'), 5'-bisphosphate nucleotidase